jgi:predicted secreted acid phosphatase
MKHRITLLASVVAILAASAMSLNVHQQATQHQLVLDAQRAASHARQVAQEQAQAHDTALKLQQDESALTKLQLACENGQVAYNMLTATQREHVVKPDCGL